MSIMWTFNYHIKDIVFVQHQWNVMTGHMLKCDRIVKIGEDYDELVVMMI